jgi:hypothetical protein
VIKNNYTEEHGEAQSFTETLILNELNFGVPIPKSKIQNRKFLKWSIPLYKARLPQTDQLV